MSLNLSDNGDYFGSGSFGYQGQNAENVMAGTQAKAVLYVFKPYENQFGRVAIRPLQYEFDDNFISETVQLTDLSKKAEVGSAALINDFMARNNLNDNMTVSTSPSMVFRGDQLSDKYRFILVLTETGSGLRSHNTVVGGNSSSNQIRRIYTGYFTDEPLNATTAFGRKPTLNPHAVLVITHKTMVGMATMHGQHGARTNVNTRSSEEIIHPELSKALLGSGYGGGEGIFLLTPENSINAIETTSGGFSIAVPGAHGDLTHDKGANVMSDIFGQPAHNVGQVLRGMVRFQDDVTHRNRLNMNHTHSYFEDDGMDASMARSRLARFMAIPRARTDASVFDLDVDSRISPVDLDARVNGDLDVISFDLERPMYYETADQMQMSVVNQYSSLIAFVVGPLLQAGGLNAMQFEYQAAKMRNEFVWDFKTHSAEPNYNVPTHDLLGMAKAVESELINGIFDTIYRSVGDFHVLVSANVTGMTTVRLNLVAQGYRTYQDFEIPTCMGGLITPMIGNSLNNAHNAEAVETLYSIATGTYLGPQSKFNDDDRNFEAIANEFTTRAKELPWNQMQTISPQDPRINADMIELD